MANGLNSSEQRETVTKEPSLQNNTPVTRYDSVVVGAIERRWDDLLDHSNGNAGMTGKVVVRFRLKPNGTVSDVKIVENDVGELAGNLSAQAITDVAPFAPWPPEMVKDMPLNYRVITFTFYYK
jgi:TonB family protein